MQTGRIRRHLGVFEDERDAAECVDSELRRTVACRSRRLSSLNFRSKADFFDLATWQSEPLPERMSSRFLGVSRRGVAGRFRARLHERSLGDYSSELDAALAFDRASLEVGGPTNFHYGPTPEPST